MILLDPHEGDQLSVRREVRVGIAAALTSPEGIPRDPAAAGAVRAPQPDAVVAGADAALVDDPLAVRREGGLSLEPLRCEVADDGSRWRQQRDATATVDLDLCDD